MIKSSVSSAHVRLAGISRVHGKTPFVGGLNRRYQSGTWRPVSICRRWCVRIWKWRRSSVHVLRWRHLCPGPRRVHVVTSGCWGCVRMGQRWGSRVCILGCILGSRWGSPGLRRARVVNFDFASRRVVERELFNFPQSAFQDALSILREQELQLHILTQDISTHRHQILNRRVDRRLATQRGSRVLRVARGRGQTSVHRIHPGEKFLE